jgi:hypothetical protein
MKTNNPIIHITDIQKLNHNDDFKINIMEKTINYIQDNELEKMEEESDVCCICLDNMSGNTYVYTICKHKIHDECYKELSISNKLDFCPLCRTKEPIQITSVVENIDNNNIRHLINIINLNVSRIHPEHVRVRTSVFGEYKLAIILSMIWILILLVIVIFALTPII